MSLFMGAAALSLGLLLPPGTAQAERPAAPVTSGTKMTGTELDRTVAAILARAPAGTRYGLLVTSMDGREIIAITPDQRFIPASNTKMFTTASAYARRAELEAASAGTAVRLEKGKGSRPDVRLIGAGDAALNSAADCTQSCLATLADAIAARTRRVNDIIGDDTLFPDERWGPGMSWNNIQSRYGTAASALTLDANELVSTVKAGKPGDIASVETPGYYSIDNQVRTVAGNESHVEQWREPHDMLLHLGGTIGVDAPPQIVRSSIDDPAHHAAWRLREMLIARGVKVKGAIDVSHRFARLDDTAEPQVQPVAGAEAPLAVVAMEPLSQNVFTINKLSQNLFAELLLRRLGHLSGSGSIKDGQTALHAIMAGAGVPETGYDLSDGSGMSSYNRITPRAAVALLTWAARQPWGAEWRTSLPIGGKDGTLRGRFGETALDGRIFAKTGTLNAASALSGYMQAKSGATLIFSIIANDYVDDDGPQARATMDAALLAIAEAN